MKQITGFMGNKRKFRLFFETEFREPATFKSLERFLCLKLVMASGCFSAL